MTSYYDDNYGHWHDTEDPEVLDHYFHVQETNVRKKCQGCGRMVSIQPQYAYCNTCADIRERGGELPGFIGSDDDEADDDIENESPDEPEPPPVDPCFQCGGRGEDCTCEEGSTDEEGEPNFCYDCNSSFRYCTCDRY